MPIVQPIDDLDLPEFAAIAASFGQQRYGYVVTPNVDHLIRCHDDPKFRAAYADAAYVLMDSRFLASVLKLTKGMNMKVCTGSDLTAHLFTSIVRPSDQILLIGGSDAQVQTLAMRFGLQSLRHFNPSMGFITRPQDVEEVLSFIESMSPFRFCLLAVGAPQQEFIAQMLKARGRARGLVLCIGASINFLTGVEKRAPRWMQRASLELAYRLAQDPGRLARRYLVRGPRIFSLLSKIQLVPRTATEPSTLP